MPEIISVCFFHCMFEIFDKLKTNISRKKITTA